MESEKPNLWQKVMESLTRLKSEAGQSNPEMPSFKYGASAALEKAAQPPPWNKGIR